MSEQHTDQNAAYNAKVREIAELLAMDNGPALLAYYKSKRDPRYEKHLKKNMSSARAMVAEMAKVSKEALYHNAPDRNPLFVNKYLFERGLIPAPETSKITDKLCERCNKLKAQFEYCHLSVCASCHNEICPPYNETHE